MPIALRLSLLFILVAIGGVALLGYAYFVNGWDALTYFVWGLIITGGGLLSVLLLAGISMIRKGPWRRFALIEVVISLILLFGLAVLWQLA